MTYKVNGIIISKRHASVCILSIHQCILTIRNDKYRIHRYGCSYMYVVMTKIGPRMQMVSPKEVYHVHI